MFGLLQFAQRLGLTVAAIDITKEDVGLPSSTNSQSPYTLNTSHDSQIDIDTPTPDNTSHIKDEQEDLTLCDLTNISDSLDTNPVIRQGDFAKSEDSLLSDSSERAGSSDRADSDVVFKTAPNTPVLAKHLTVVSDELVIDDHSQPQESVRSVDSSPAGNPPVEELGLSSALGDNKEEEAASPPSEPVDIVLESTDSVPVPGESELRRSADMCEEMSHGPGELYDIAEEETSEEEADQSEEEEESEDEDEDEDDDSGNVTQPTIEDEYPDEIIKKNQVNKETRELEARLSARETESNKLLCTIDELQRDVMVKSGGMERLQAELTAAYKESEFVKKRLKKVEEDLDVLRQRNAELTEELEKKSVELIDAEDCFDFNHLLEVEKQVKELTLRVKELESQLEHLRQERNQLEQRAQTLETERLEERRIIQEALDSALAEKQSIQTKFEKDFERLRTVNTDREQQLLDDFEWKLREVNQACKKRLDEKENSCKQRIKTMEDKLNAAEQELTQLERLKQFEAEATMLRGLNLEQQRALRFAERAKEELQVSEKVLHEEVRKLKEFLDKEKSALTTMQAIHNREIDEKERKMRFRLEQQKTELNNQWEEKLKKETIKLRVELDQVNRDEKRLVLQSARLEKEAELQKAKELWEHQFKELQNQIEALKQKILDEEEEHKNKIENIRTSADCDIFELRRKLDRIDISYQDKIEKLQNEHEAEKERLVEEAERRLQSCEQSWQMQLSSTRATLELVKEQLKREAAEREEALQNNHRRQLEEQWDQLAQERDEIIAVIEEKHKANIEKLKAELEATYKSCNSKEQELVDKISILQDEDCGKKRLIGDLTKQNETLEENINEISKKYSDQKEHFHQAQEEMEKKIKLLEQTTEELDHWRTTAHQLQSRLTQQTRQLEQSSDSKLVEDLRKALIEKEQQVAQLSKEKHLYQLELMNRNCHGEATTVTARQRRRGNRGKPNKSGPSRGQNK
ncbi:myosin-10 isoform X2 [Macrosteles quadrilineatus]|uniref:myosin-10 isoform X2 n=1 Tax=Macrosteles quadrilineatus TaxID=74068 RepID=UPI0023E139D2|nr:myosin-10 isoform X2 [Macrosteles quadrilineatus]